MGEYIASLALSADKLGPDLLQMVPDVYGGTVPRLLIDMGGDPNLNNRCIMSVTIFNLIANKTFERGDSEHAQPTTIMQYVRTLLAYMKNRQTLYWHTC